VIYESLSNATLGAFDIADHLIGQLCIHIYCIRNSAFTE